MNIHACTNGVSTIAIPKLGWGLDQMKWQEVVRLLRDIFAYAGVQKVVYNLEHNGVHAMSVEGDADDEMERYSEEFFLENHELETDFAKDFESYQPTCDEQFPVFRKRDHNTRLIDHYLQNQPEELTNYVKVFDFQYSNITDEEMILLIGMLVDGRDVYSQQIFDRGRALQKFHVTQKPNVEPKQQRPCKIPLHLKENWKNYSHN